MIKVKHPDPKVNAEQEKALQNCTPQEQRQRELLFTHRNILAKYYAHPRDGRPTLEDWQEWILTLSLSMQVVIKEVGFEESKHVSSFVQYVKDKNSMNLVDYLQKYMGSQDFEEFNRLGLKL